MDRVGRVAQRLSAIESGSEPFPLPILAHVSDTFAHALGRAHLTRGAGAPVQLDRAIGRRVEAVEGAHQLGAAGAEETGDAEDLAAAQLEARLA